MKYKVPVAEGAAFRVFSREPDWNPVCEQTREGEGLAMRPVDPIIESVALLLTLAAQLVKE